MFLELCFSINGMIKGFLIEILDYGDKVTLTKKDQSMKITLYESDSNPVMIIVLF